MFCPFRPRYACILATLGLSGLLSSSACDGLDPCEQFRKDYDELLVSCGYEPPERNESPDCTGPIAQLNGCLSECLEDAPCEALESGTAEQIEHRSCATSCENKHLPD